MKTNIISIIIIVLFLTICIINYFTIKSYKKEVKELNAIIEQYQEAANPSGEVIDSLVYNIEYRDSIIYNIKTEYIKDVEVIKTLSDSALVDNFYKLVWAE